jgi:excisionase family DNA binding protein
MTRYLTTREVADYIRVSPETVLRWWRANPKKIPGGRRVNGVLRFRAEVVEQWVEAGGEMPGQDGHV